MKKQANIKNIAVIIILALGALTMIFPFFWMLVSATKTWAECNSTPPTLFPANPTLMNFVYAFKTAPFLQYFRNSLIVTLICVSVTMFNTILAAYGYMPTDELWVKEPPVPGRGAGAGKTGSISWFDLELK